MKEKKPINIEIGQHVKKYRETAGLTQENFLPVRLEIMQQRKRMQ